MNNSNWTKEQLKIYILLLCTYADDVASKEEITIINSHTKHTNFDIIHQEFINDSHETRVAKIEKAISHLEFDIIELMELRNEIHQVFIADKVFNRKEKYIESLLDNLLY
jgi:hypothetical protein